MQRSTILFFFLLAPLSAYAEVSSLTESLEDLLAVETEQEAQVGSRENTRSESDSKVPIDIIDHHKINRLGATSLTDVLRLTVAGFNAPMPAISDGSAYVRAMSLRGMGADQMLVLVNGKRLHSSAMLHVNSTLDRGTTQVDLDTIPLISIERIEILRDGAAAQYGSDAISGVINIILKAGNQSNQLSAQLGQTDQGDGQDQMLQAFMSNRLAYDGFWNLSFQGLHQGFTQRAGTDSRLSPPKQTSRFGQPETKNYKALFNGQANLENDISFYSDLLIASRNSESDAFYRPVTTTSQTLYPNGFVPLLQADIEDTSFNIGIKGKDYFNWDLSNKFGSSRIQYDIKNTMNYSLGSNSQTRFALGALKSTQNTTNLDLKKQIAQWSIALGAEYRIETYRLEKGEANSFAGTGSQGFSGYRDTNETNNERRSSGLYFDSTYDLSEDFSVEGAIRYENYSDFGETSNLKTAMSYQLSPPLMFRSAVSTGFRAPSLSQSFYSQTSTFADSNNTLNYQGTFTVDHEVSKSLGAEPLKPEKSTHFTVGLSYKPSNQIQLLADYFYTQVSDRILLSDELTVSNSINQQYGIARARYFTNAIDTNTQGVDLKVDYQHSFKSGFDLTHQIWYNYSQNEIEKINTSAFTEDNSFDQIVAIEEGNPNHSLKLYNEVRYKDYLLMLNVSRYGEYTNARGGQKYHFDPSWIFDATLEIPVKKHLMLSIGGQNLFNTLPEKWDNLSGVYYGQDGIIPYSKYAPIGYNGAYYFAKVNYEF